MEGEARGKNCLCNGGGHDMQKQIKIIRYIDGALVGAGAALSAIVSTQAQGAVTDA
jgi:hypothetical protein